MNNTPRGFTILPTSGVSQRIKLYCGHCKQTLAETFGYPTLDELTTSAHSHRKVCP